MNQKNIFMRKRILINEFNTVGRLVRCVGSIEVFLSVKMRKMKDIVLESERKFVVGWKVQSTFIDFLPARFRF